MKDLGKLVVTRADIARLAGVRRPAVTNWERRHQDFPAPVPSPEPSGTDVFRADEVAAWLGRRTAPANVRQDGELAGTTFGDRFRAGLDRGDFERDNQLVGTKAVNTLLERTGQEPLQALTRTTRLIDGTVKVAGKVPGAFEIRKDVKVFDKEHPQAASDIKGAAKLFALLTTEIPG